MKKSITIYLTTVLLLTSISFTFSQTPVSKYGRLKLVGKQLSSECGDPIQLRGMSSHGIQWYRSCLNVTSLGLLLNDWNIDVLRVAMYIGEGGYLTDSTAFKNTVNSYVNYCDRNGIYSIIDWHVLTPGDPNTNINEAKGFWDYMSKTHSGKKNVIYEICNEPNGVNWNSVKNYANTIIPIIRANDKEAIILVGTPNYSSDLDSPANSPLTGTNAYNVMYTYHFYSASHMGRLGNFNANTAKIPIFVSEWGTSDYTGGGSIDLNGAQQWIDNFNGTNAGGVKISWTNWNFSDAPETSAALTPKACANGTFTSLTASGTKVKYWLSNPAKIGSACVFGPTCKTPTLGNDISICGSTGGISLNSGLTAPNRTFTWKKDGQIITGSAPTLQVSQAGTYSVVVDTIGCSKTDEIIVSATLPAVNLGSTVDLCKPATAVLDAGVSGNGITYAWKIGPTPFGGNTKTIQVYKAGTYSVTISSNGCQSSTGFVNVTSSLPNVTGDTVCASGGIAKLMVSGAGNYNWYNMAQGGSVINTGNTYSPQVSISSKTYYVEASAGQDYKVGPANSGTSPWNVTDYTVIDKKIVIQALTNVLLKSISVDASADETVSINFTDQSTGTIVKTATLSVSAGFNIIPINFNLVSGKSYTVDGVGSTDALKFNNSSSVVWPQTVPNIATVMSGAPNYANSWSAFYDVTFSTGSACDRVPVIAYVDQCTGLEEDAQSQMVSNIYPNPFTENFTVNLGSNFKDVLKVEVTDQEGKILETFNSNNVLPELQIGTKLSNGQYFVRIIRSNKVEIKSVIKLK